MSIFKSQFFRYSSLLYPSVHSWTENEKKAYIESHTQWVRMNPVYFEIHDTQGNFKGSILGVEHNLRRHQLSLDNIPDAFDANAKIQQAFANAKTYANEIDSLQCTGLSRVLLWDRSETDQGMDARFEAMAHFEGKKVVALESVTQEYVTKTIESSLATVAHRATLSISDQNDCSTRIRDLLIDGNLENFSSFDRKCCSLEEKKFDLNRHEQMGTNAHRFLQEEKGPLFITVGVFHLATENNLCAQLQTRGWVVKRVSNFDQT